MDIATLIGYLLNPIIGVVSWIAGTRSRRNSVYQEMLATIKTLTEQNKELHEEVVKLQDELIEVRRENAELKAEMKAGQEQMTTKLNELQNENTELLEHVMRTGKIPAPKKSTK